jgi:hypothetical protein
MTTNITARILATLEDTAVRDDDGRHHNAALIPALVPAITPQATTYPSEILVANLDGTNGFRIDGHVQGDYIGHAVASADVNGDGFFDLILGSNGIDFGAPPDDPANHTFNRGGAAYVIYGSAAGFAAHTDIASLINGTAGFEVQGVARTAEEFGHTVSSAGDLNGDGFDDFVVTDKFGHFNTSDTASAYVVLGKAGGFPPVTGNNDGTFDDGTFGFILPTVVAGPNQFLSTSHGDINGDGFDDLIVGDTLLNDGATYHTGKTYVVFGHSGTFGASISIGGTLNGDGTSGFSITGALRDGAGFSVDATGDINGDGIDDIIMSAITSHLNGKVYVVFGKASGWAADLNVTTLDGTNGFAFGGTFSFSGFADRVASAGDINGDGFDDIAMNENYGDGDAIQSGAAYVLFGHAGAFANNLSPADINGTNGIKINGVAGGDYAGYSIAAAGDINGDGFDDLIVGAFNASVDGTHPGAAYVVFGAASFAGGVVDLATLATTGQGFRITGESHFSNAGWSVSAGDLNGDGVPDIIVGANDATHDGKAYNGSTYVVYGIKPTGPVSLTGNASKDNIAGSDLADTLGGSNGNDYIYGNGGNDLITAGVGHVHLFGGTGDDGFAMHGTLDPLDRIDGGPGGNDQIGLEGDYSAGITLDGNHITGIEVVAMMQGFDYKITVLDNFLSAGELFTFWSVSMGAPNHVFLDGHLETDGHFKFFMGAGGDTAIGGGGADLFYGEGGADRLTGNGGVDTFAYLGVSDSNGTGGTAYDTITDFTAGSDRILLAGTAVSAVNAAASGTLSAGSFDSDLAAVLGSGQAHELDAGHAVLFTATGGLNGHTFLIVGTAGAPSGYLAGADYVIDVTGGTLGGLAPSDFI